MGERIIIHLKDGGVVTIDGDRIEVTLTGPMVFHRSRWVRPFSPEEEVRRMLLMKSHPAEKALVEAFRAVPMIVYSEPRDDT